MVIQNIVSVDLMPIEKQMLVLMEHLFWRKLNIQQEERRDLFLKQIDFIQMILKMIHIKDI
ncbi:hypothetical protein D3C87_2094640 [compost metagenome]